MEVVIMTGFDHDSSSVGSNPSSIFASTTDPNTFYKKRIVDM